MKAAYYSGLLLLFSMIFINACKESSTNAPEDTLEGIFFPNSNGTWYKYNINRTDSTGTQTTGARTSTYLGTQMVGTTEFQVQIDTIEVAGIPQSLTNISLFRSTEDPDNKSGGVFYFVDTTGFSSFVPDSFAQYIGIDSEFRLFSFPFASGSDWIAFQVNLQYGFISLTLIEVKGFYQGIERVDVNLTSGTVSKDAAKVRYVLKLQIPNPDNLLDIRSQQYEANAWAVEGIGIVKWQGNGAILGAFTGSGIDLGDTTSVVSQNLVQYSIK